MSLSFFRIAVPLIDTSPYFSIMTQINLEFMLTVHMKKIKQILGQNFFHFDFILTHSLNQLSIETQHSFNLIKSLLFLLRQLKPHIFWHFQTPLSPLSHSLYEKQHYLSIGYHSSLTPPPKAWRTFRKLPQLKSMIFNNKCSLSLPWLYSLSWSYRYHFQINSSIKEPRKKTLQIWLDVATKKRSK